MESGPESEEPRPAPFPGAGFWKGLEQLVVTLGLGTPRNIFRIRQARARWEEKRAAQANVDRGVAYTHKACPACGRLVARGGGRCEYCGASVRWAPGPGIARTLGLSIPHGSVAMTIVTLNIVLFGISTLLSARSSGSDMFRALVNADVRTLYNLGGLYAGSVLDGEVWRLWTYQFLHGGALHIVFNTYALLSLGPATEDVYGPTKTATLYWTTGTAAGFVTFAFRYALFVGSGGTARNFPVVIGASGAIFGLIGLLIGHTIHRGGAQGANLRAFLVRWAVYGLLMGFMIGADNAAHVGGLAAGFLLGLVVPDGEPKRGPGVLFWRLAALSVIGLSLYGFVAAALAPRA